MSSTEESMKHSDPIPIVNPNRSRSLSVSSLSSDSASSSSNPQTPPLRPSVNIPQASPSTSPILSYFLAQSPTKAQSPKTPTFPFVTKGFGTANHENEPPVAVHARRVASRFISTNAPMPTDAQRGTNVLRRLSLSSGTFTKPTPPPLDTTTRSPPSPPPNTAVSPTPHTAVSKTAPFANKPHRSATISTDGGKPRRAPSPMGERILKGHFDGFN